MEHNFFEIVGPLSNLTNQSLIEIPLE